MYKHTSKYQQNVKYKFPRYVSLIIIFYIQIVFINLTAITAIDFSSGNWNPLKAQKWFGTLNKKDSHFPGPYNKEGISCTRIKVLTPCFSCFQLYCYGHNPRGMQCWDSSVQTPSIISYNSRKWWQVNKLLYPVVDTILSK